MGYPMAINLRTKLGPEYKLLICDVSSDALHKFQDEMQEKKTGPVEVVANGFEAVKAAVLITNPPL